MTPPPSTRRPGRPAGALGVPSDPELVEEPAELTPSVRVTKLQVKVLGVPNPQYQVAALAGIHPSVFSLYVHGKKDIQAHHIVSLCKLFGCEPEEIMGWVDTNVFYASVVPSEVQASTPGERYGNG